MKTKSTCIATLFHNTTRRTLQVILVLIATLLAINASLAATYPTPKKVTSSSATSNSRAVRCCPNSSCTTQQSAHPCGTRPALYVTPCCSCTGPPEAGSYFFAQFSDVLFGPGQPLDATRCFIILPDSIGHGKSSKPSDSLRARFPHYNVEDMVVARVQLVTEKLGINHLRLVMGVSMGGSHTWLWGTKYADFTDAIVPLGALPVEMGAEPHVATHSHRCSAERPGLEERRIHEPSARAGAGVAGVLFHGQKPTAVADSGTDRRCCRPDVG